MSFRHSKKLWKALVQPLPEDRNLFEGKTGGKIKENTAEWHVNYEDIPDGNNSDSNVGNQTPYSKPWVMSLIRDEIRFVNDYQDENGNGKTDRIVEDGALNPGEWHHIVVNTKWARYDKENGNGFMKIWVNGDKVYDHEGATVINTKEPPRPLKLSIYNSLWDQPGAPEERTIWFDDVRLGTEDATYEDMMAGRK